MKQISIKYFAMLMILLFFAGGGMVFYTFFEDSKKSAQSLLEENIQVSLLNLKYFLDKNLKQGNINQIRAYLDNMIHSNNVLEDFHIVSDEKKLIYATDRDSVLRHENIACVPISKIIDSNIFEQECYTFSIKLFNRLKPYYYEGTVYLDHSYLDSLLKDKIVKYFTLFVLTLLFLSLFLWFITRKVLVQPLEALREFSQDASKVPSRFWISEIESVRMALDTTFKRLQKEQKEIFNLSTRDPLSGLYNRLSLIEKVNMLIEKSKESDLQFALLFLDLDNFKTINDSRGHEFGDKVLKRVSEVLLASVRDHDIVSRLGGDEFVIVLRDIEDDESILKVIERIQEGLMEPVVFDNHKYRITCSIGIALYPKDGENVTELLKNADMAMYKSKELGKNNFHFFIERLKDELHEQVKIERLMHTALEKGNFQLFYQPKVEIETNKIVGCEALIRLIDPDEGFIPPDKFIHIAEKNGFIIPLGDWIIEEAVRQLKSWEGTALAPLKLSINVSSVQFRDKNFYDKIASAIRQIDPAKFDLELTESILLDHFEEKLALIEALKKLGVTLSLDDFGTGYSSLSYLKKIPFNTLKIDKSFIDDLQDPKDQSFVNMIVTIARELDLEVVAEGVEDEKQLAYLKKIHCSQYQGYYCSRPLPIEEFEAFVTQHALLVCKE